MRQYEYSVDGGTDHDGRKVYAVLCRSWDDFDQDAEAWTRVVAWYTDHAVALREAEAFQANADEAREAIRHENEAAGFVSAARPDTGGAVTALARHNHTVEADTARARFLDRE